MNCHASIKSGSEQLLWVRESYTSGQSVPWIKIHDEPDFVAAYIDIGIEMPVLLTRKNGFICIFGWFRRAGRI